MSLTSSLDHIIFYFLFTVQQVFNKTNDFTTWNAINRHEKIHAAIVKVLITEETYIQQILYPRSLGLRPLDTPTYAQNSYKYQTGETGGTRKQERNQ